MPDLIPPKTFGIVRLVGDVWAIECEPHVRMRMKRIFGKLAQNRRGILSLTASDENSRELEWFIQRWPLEVADPEILEERARAFDARAHRTVEILAGSRLAPPSNAMALPPRDYQRVAAALVKNNGSLLCADVLGTGKTVTAITFLADPDALPALVVVPAHLGLQWKKEVQRFLPFYEVHLVRQLQPYPVDFLGREPDVLIISYAKMRGWADHLAGRVRTVVFDEVQELRRRASQKYHACAMVTVDAAYKLGLSHTPIYNYGDEFYPVLDVLAPGCLGTWTEFATEWCKDGYGDKREIIDPKAFGTYLRERGLMIRRTRKDIGREIPPLEPIVHQIDANVAELRKLEGTRQLAEFIVSGRGKPVERMTAAGQFDLEMRQATGLAKAPYVAEFVKMLLESGPVMLYGWHRAVYDIWLEKLKDWKPLMYTGSESPAKKERAKLAFIQGESPLMILSLRSGSGLDGCQAVCSRIVFGELDWSPGVHDQCIGRAWRDGQEDPVMAYYLACEVGSDPTMIDVLGVKESQAAGVTDPTDELVVPRTVDPNHVRKLAEAYLGSGGAR